MRISSMIRLASVVLAAACNNDPPAAKRGALPVTGPGPAVASAAAGANVQPAAPSPRQVAEHKVGQFRAEEQRLLEKLVPLMSPDQMVDLRGQSGRRTQVAFHSDPEAARLLTRLYEIRALDGAARLRDNGKDAARHVPKLVHVTLRDDAATIRIRREAGYGRVTVLLPSDVTSADVAAAMSVLQQHRADFGDFAVSAEDFEVRAEGTPPAFALQKHARMLQLLRARPVQVGAEGAARVLPVSLPPVGGQ